MASRQRDPFTVALYKKVNGAHQRYPGRISVHDLRALISRNGRTCHWCGKQNLEGGDFTLEHLFPINTPEAIVFACWKCNCSRKAGIPHPRLESDEERKRHDILAAKRWREAHPAKQKEATAKWRRENKEKVLAAKRAYWARNRESINLTRKEKRLANLEEVLKQRRAKYQANRDAINAARRQYWESNKEAIAEKRRAAYHKKKQQP